MSVLYFREIWYEIPIHPVDRSSCASVAYSLVLFFSREKIIMFSFIHLIVCCFLQHINFLGAVNTSWGSFLERFLISPWYSNCCMSLLWSHLWYLWLQPQCPPCHSSGTDSTEPWVPVFFQNVLTAHDHRTPSSLSSAPAHLRVFFGLPYLK